MNKRLFRLLQQQGLRKGLIGGSRRWLTIWSVLATWRIMGRLLGNKPVVERFTLDEGDTLLITDLGVPHDAT